MEIEEKKKIIEEKGKEMEKYIAIYLERDIKTLREMMRKDPKYIYELEKKHGIRYSKINIFDKETKVRYKRENGIEIDEYDILSNPRMIGEMRDEEIIRKVPRQIHEELIKIGEKEMSERCEKLGIKKSERAKRIEEKMRK